MKYFGCKSVSCILTALAVLAGFQCGVSRAQLSVTDQSGFMIEPDRQQTLEWAAGAATAQTLPYSIIDYRGKQISSGTAHPADGKVQIPVTLPRGYYEIRFQAPKQHFGFVVLPEFLGSRDSFYGLDSVLIYNQLQKREAAFKLLKKAGISVSRERVHWRTLQPETGKWNLNDMKIKSLHELYRQYNIGVLDTVEYAPRWTKLSESTSYPDDLHATVNSWERMAKEFGDTWQGVEVLNEVDIDRTNLPADQYLPMVKAVAWSFQRNQSNHPIGGGVFSSSVSNVFLNQSGANGILQASDFIAFHYYSKSCKDLIDHVTRYRQWAKKFGRENIPLWITETGRGWPPADGLMRPAVDVDQKLAMELAMNCVEAKACGVKKIFPFVLNTWPGGETLATYGNKYGLFGQERSALRIAAAYFQNIRVLSGKQYIGDFRLKDNNVERARVFADEQSAVAVFYAPGAKEDSILTLDLAPQRIEAADGRELQVTENSKIPLADGIVYAWFNADQISPMLITDTAAMRLHDIGVKSDARPYRDSIVLQPVYSREQARASSLGYYLTAEQAKQFPLTLRVANLGDQDATIKLSAQLPGEISVPDGTLQVQAHHTAEYCWLVDLSKALHQNRFSSLEISAKNEAGTTVDSVNIRLCLRPEDTTYAAVQAEDIKVDGILDEPVWGKAVAITKLESRRQETETPFSAEDLSAVVRMAWDQTGLYFAAEVHDQVHHIVRPGLQAWTGDSIQIALDPTLMRSVKKYGEYDSELTIFGDNSFAEIFRSKGLKSIKSLSKSTVAAVRRDETRKVTVYEAKIAWEDVVEGDELNRKRLGVNFVINDNDAHGRRGYLQWSDGIAVSKDPSLFPEVELKNNK